MRFFGLVTVALYICSATSMRARAQDVPAVSTPRVALPATHADADTPTTTRLEPWAVPPQAHLDPRGAALRAELVLVDRELMRLRAAVPRVRPFVRLVVLGTAAGVVGGLLSVALWAGARERGYRWDEQGNRSAYSRIPADERPIIALTAVVAGLGVVAAGYSIAQLVPRVRVRGELAEQTESLMERRKTLLQELRYSLNVDSRGVTVNASLSL